MIVATFNGAIAHVSRTQAVGNVRPSNFSLMSKKPRHVVRAGFNEGAAQVRRLLDRDRKELNFDELEKTFTASEDENIAATLDADRDAPTQLEATPSNSGAMFAADKTPVSPLGPSSTSNAPANPFAASPSPRTPFGGPAGLRPDMPPADIPSKPWWQEITLTQVVIVLSFTTIISLMIATFFVVVNMGAVRFNE